MRRIGFLLSLWIWGFTTAWFASSPWKRMAGGVPFLIVVAFLLVSTVSISGVDLGLRRDLLDRQLATALSSDDWETARLVLGRRIQSAPKNRDVRLNMAKVLDALGERERAVALMRGLTFLGSEQTTEGTEETQQSEKLADAQRWRRFGGADPRAARWMVEHVYLAEKWEELSDRDKRDCLDLLRWLCESAPHNVPLRKLYAEQLLKAERYRDALPVLVSMIQDEPSMGLRAAVIARSLGEESHAVDYAEESLAQFTELVHQEPSNSSRSVALAQCQVFLSQHAAAVQTIRSAITRSADQPERQRLGQVLAEAVAVWAQSLESETEENPTERLQLLTVLQIALQHAPNNQRVLEVVVKQVLATADEQDQQIALLRESLTRGTSPGIAHFIRGTAAVMQGDADKAKLHLEIAAKTLPANDAILNNLAYVIAQQEGADLEQALQISEAAISQASPVTAHHLETRGQILVKMERYAEAVADLEAALSVPTLATAAHRSLAECYHHLGAEDLSEQHRQAAQKATTPPATP